MSEAYTIPTGGQVPAGCNVKAICAMVISDQHLRPTVSFFPADHGGGEIFVRVNEIASETHEDMRRELHRQVDELIDASAKASKCDLPPAGWSCTRKPEHMGPCAAVPVGERSER